jgi:3-isopropylmalate/(R)-2-methylmalate dehydratase large subunit
MPEAGLVYPGMILIATDSHTTTHGAFGAFGAGVGATDMAAILITGELWLRVPEVIEIHIEGEAPPGVYPKDVILHILGAMKADGAVYKAVDFTGSYIDSLDVAGRMVLCNMALEMGAKTAYMQPNQAVLDYVSKRAVRPFTVYSTDPAYEYAEKYEFEISSLEPQLAFPSSVDNVFPLSAAAGVKIDQGVIGTCTGGRVEDFEAAAGILRGRRIAPGTRLIIVPASREVLSDCIQKGYIQDFIAAGAVIATPGCGPCLGAHDGVLAPGEVCITASNRNFPGRMGSAESKLYLASPAAVAASVLEGSITDPRPYLEARHG